jgi:hypothetical protein
MRHPKWDKTTNLIAGVAGRVGGFRGRLRNKLRKLLGRRQLIACRLRQIDAELRNQDDPEGSRAAAS